MGVSIITKGYNAEGNFPSGGPFLPFDVPVRTGLVGFHLPGVDSAKTLFNFAPGGAQGCSLVGDPVYSAGFVSLLSRANASPAYIQTPYPETGNLYMAAVCRFPGLNDATGTRGVLMSVVGSLGEDGVTTYNTALHIRPTSTTQVVASVMRGATAGGAAEDARTITAPIGVSGNLNGSWMLLTFEAPLAAASVFRNETTGVSSTGSAVTQHRLAQNLIRLGSSFNTSNGGQVDIAGLGLWSTIPDADGKAAIIAALRANAASKGITV